MRVVIETRRLLLREMTDADLDFVAAMLADAEVMRYFPRCCSRDEARAWIERQLARYADHGFGYWMIVDKAGGKSLGQAGVLPTDIDGELEPALGYILHRPFWRRGFATEAARGCRDYVLVELERERAVTLIRPKNIPSQAVAVRIGMHPERRVEHAGYEHVLYAVGRDEVLAPRADGAT
jgi:RimJ/RimL family protein N-acetyltransferase